MIGEQPPTAISVLAAKVRRERELPAPLPPELAHFSVDPSLLRTAFHEAGHAVAELVLGFEVDFATIQPTLELSGYVQPRYPPDAPVRDRVVVLLAGREAEHRHDPVLAFDELPRVDRLDLADVEFLLAVERAVLPKAVTADQIERYRPAATRLVHRHWGWITRVAFALVAVRRLSGDEIVRLRGRR
jgi:hypothetical protein